MEIRLSDSLEAFRGEVSAFIEENLPDDIRRRVERQEFLDRDTHLRWHRTLLEKGWAAPSWPRDHGGTGWSLAEQYVFEQALAAHDAPRMIAFGFDMVGPMLIRFGTETQKRRFLSKILCGEEWWCQGFSEPNSGSDLASLQCRAERDGHEYVLNGSKMWTTSAHFSDWMFGLFRTEHAERKQLGITVLMLDMKSPGLTIQPIITFDGGHEVNQCFFDEVRVPVTQRIGDEGAGWSIAKYVLGLERLGIAEVARSKAMLARLNRIAHTERSNGLPLARDPSFAQRLAGLEIDLLALEATEQSFLFDPALGEALGAEASILKIRGSELQQSVSELTVDALGYYALPREPDAGSNREQVPPRSAGLVAETYFNLRKISIYGGSNEIQKNIVAKAVLGL